MTLIAISAIPTTVSAKSLKPASNFVNEQASFACVVREANHWNVPLAVFLAVNSIEQGRTTPVGNSNGSQDLGAFQINTIHLPTVQSKFGGTKQDLLYKGCFNAHVAGYLLDKAINQPSKQHLDYYTRVAGYHSWTPVYNSRYRSKLVRYVGDWERWLKNNGY